MDSKNILKDTTEVEISKEELAKKLHGVINPETGWVTIPVTKKMVEQASKLQGASDNLFIK